MVIALLDNRTIATQYCIYCIYVVQNFKYSYYTVILSASYES